MVQLYSGAFYSQLTTTQCGCVVQAFAAMATECDNSVVRLRCMRHTMYVSSPAFDHIFFFNTATIHSVFCLRNVVFHNNTKYYSVELSKV